MTTATRTFLLAATLAAVQLGCDQFKAAPLVSPSQFPNALVGIERQTEAIFAAFEAGRPRDADGPLHQIGSLFGTAERLAGPVGLSEEERAKLKVASDKLLDAFAELHAPMHEKEFPADFDFAPVRAKLEAGLLELRAAVPADIAQTMQQKQDERAAASAAEESAAFVPGASEPEAKPAAADADAGKSSSAQPAAPDGGAALPIAAGTVAGLYPSVQLWDDAARRAAPEQVSRVAALLDEVPPAARWVQLVPALHVRLTADLHIAEFGEMIDRRGSWDSAENFRPAADSLAERLRETFAAALGQAVRRGLGVALLPHLDAAGGPVSEWRNNFDFAPTEIIGAGSYESLMVEPLAAAIEAEAVSSARIDFALSGEMGRSFLTHPNEYRALLERLRARFAANPRTAGVRLGVALNWSGNAGQLTDDQIDPPAVAAALAACDFVGFSCYAPVSLPPAPEDFRTAVRDFAGELATLAGGPVTVPIVISEVGLGGGERGATPADAAAKPFEGGGTDWRAPEFAALRRGFHDALLGYLAAAQPPTVERAFLWTDGPWDPQGIDAPKFADAAIAGAIAAHNARSER